MSKRKVAESRFTEKVGQKEIRKLHARKSGKNSVWFGLGMLGLIGWSVAIPTLVGAGAGFWLDHRYPGRFSWTLMLLVGGLILGSLNAWHWMQKEKTLIEKEEEDNNE